MRSPQESSAPAGAVALGSYPNREEWAYALRTLAGQGVIAGLVLFFLVILALGIVLGPGPTWLFAAMFAVFGSATAVLAGYGLRYIDRRTPHTLEISAASVRAMWPDATGREVSVPFGAIRALNPRYWRYVGTGKGSHFLFVPAALSFDLTQAVFRGRWDPAVQSEGTIYLTDENATRLRAALGWDPDRGTPAAGETPPANLERASPEENGVLFRVESAIARPGGAWDLTGVEVDGTLRVPSLVRLSPGPRSTFLTRWVRVVRATPIGSSPSMAITPSLEAVVRIEPASEGTTLASLELEPIPEVRPGDSLST